jgi:hypothetical protein
VLAVRAGYVSGFFTRRRELAGTLLGKLAAGCEACAMRKIKSEGQGRKD